MRNKHLIKLLGLTLISFFLFGCVNTKASTHSYQSFTTEKQSNLGEIYDQAAQYQGPRRNPVIIIPGFLGSRLIDPETKKIVWGDFSLTPLISLAKESKKILTASNLPINAKESSLLALPMLHNKAVYALKDDAVPDGVLEKVDVSYLGLSINVGAYSYLIDALGAGKYRHEPRDKKKDIDYGDDYYTSFEFAYDWRQDLTQTAKKLHKFILEK